MTGQPFKIAQFCPMTLALTLPPMMAQSHPTTMAKIPAVFITSLRTVPFYIYTGWTSVSGQLDLTAPDLWAFHSDIITFKKPGT